jgi:hypothetical protein
VLCKGRQATGSDSVGVEVVVGRDCPVPRGQVREIKVLFVCYIIWGKSLVVKATQRKHDVPTGPFTIT